MVKKALLVVLLFIFNFSVFAQGAASPPDESLFTKDFWVKVTIAVISAILAFLSAYILAQLKQRKEPKKQLSYNVSIREGLVEVKKDVREKVKVLSKYRTKSCKAFEKQSVPVSNPDCIIFVSDGRSHDERYS